MKSYFFLLIACCGFISLSAQEPYLFEEQNGLVVIESTSVPEFSSWNKDTSFAGFTGADYLRYEGSNLYNDPGHSRLVYKVQISKTGTYRLQWRSRITAGTSNTDHNDSWLRLPDASSFYAQKPNSTLYPHGSGQAPNPAGAGKQGWFKVYQNVLDNWTWNTSTSDHDPHSIYARFDSVGVYTIEVAGRSFGHSIDRIVLYHSEVSATQALDLNQSESPKSVVSSIQIETQHLKVFPNPAQGQLEFQLPASFMPGQQEIKIMDLSGRLVKKHSQLVSAGDRIIIPLSAIASGAYFLLIETEQEAYRTRFVKL
ncbi:MAG: T9SS type A sorting domain-containing protein [Bacteroidota bacterium]